MLTRYIAPRPNLEDAAPSCAYGAALLPFEREAKNELGRFFLAAKELHAKENKLAFMPVCFIDTVWHRTLADRTTFDAWTINLVDEKVEHVPNPGEGVLSWVPTYERLFGPLPQIWFANPQGIVDHLAYDRYRRTGNIYASWQCAVGHMNVG
ncbi:MAG TPA: hypothetical protein VGZ00_07280 [Candidatus Baltobacteraceae bacterium]|jgi:hypothetical protein|nr:hypothetical protein [Candidatus Baltobacteraceae bacterium]